MKKKVEQKVKETIAISIKVSILTQRLFDKYPKQNQKGMLKTELDEQIVFLIDEYVEKAHQETFAGRIKSIVARFINKLIRKQNEN